MLTVIRLIAHMFVGIGICVFLFPGASEQKRQQYIQNWSKKLLTICHLRVVVKGTPLRTSVMMVSNHLSWLDIFVMNSVQASHFVAKASIRSWPFIGTLCAKAGTIFIEREQLKELRVVREQLVQELKNGGCVAFFPEGKTASQGEVLPFHGSLFSAATDAGVPVQPYALRYVHADGTYHEAVEFTGDISIVDSVSRIAKARDITVELIALPAIDSTNETRKSLTQKTEDAVKAVLSSVEVN